MTPKEECEQLLDALLAFAEQQIKKRGGFYPYGAVILADGSITLTACADDGEYHDAAGDIALLTAAHKSEAEQGVIRASGIAWDGRFQMSDGTKGDAMFVSLEHRDHYSVVVVQPYRKRLFRAPETGELFALVGLHEIFSESDDARGEASE